MFIIFIFTQNIKIIRNILTRMTVSSANAQISCYCPLYDDVISQDSNLFSEVDLSIFDETFLEEVDPVDFLKEIKEDVTLGC